VVTDTPQSTLVFCFQVRQKNEENTRRFNKKDQLFLLVFRCVAIQNCFAGDELCFALLFATNNNTRGVNKKIITRHLQIFSNQRRSMFLL
jgi:hypothetical protein